jgi:hypothetical protein
MAQLATVRVRAANRQTGSVHAVGELPVLNGEHGGGLADIVNPGEPHGETPGSLLVPVHTGGDDPANRGGQPLIP